MSFYRTVDVVGITIGEEYIVTKKHKAVLFEKADPTNNQRRFFVKFVNKDHPNQGGITLNVASSSSNPVVLPCQIKSILCTTELGYVDSSNPTEIYPIYVGFCN